MRSPCEWPQSMRLVTNIIYMRSLDFVLLLIEETGKGKFSVSCLGLVPANTRVVVRLAYVRPFWRVYRMRVYDRFGGGSGVCSKNKQYFTPAKFTAVAFLR